MVANIHGSFGSGILDKSLRQDCRSLVGPPLNIGHRGASGEAPENTWASFELAIRQGADGIEFDVHLSRDDVPVIIHDMRLERTTSGRGQVRDHSVSELQRLDAGSWFNQKFPTYCRSHYARMKIPLLAEVLDWIRVQKYSAFIEIKQGRRLYSGVEVKVLAEIQRTETQGFVRVVSFDFPTLQRIREIDREIRLGLNFTRPLMAVARAKTLSAECVLPHWLFASKRLIQRCHQAGMRVFDWDLDDENQMRQNLLDGIDGIITNRPARLADVRQRLEAKNL